MDEGGEGKSGECDEAGIKGLNLAENIFYRPAEVSLRKLQPADRFCQIPQSSVKHDNRTVAATQ
jgi:hypothetical protein